jgi:glycosyltransferase involved in cell wall biosynthesis
LKLVLANPGVGPFVQQTALALLEAELLDSYWTTFVDRPDARWRKMLVQLVSRAGWNIEQELGRRAVQEVPASLLHDAPFWEGIRSVLARLRADPRLVDFVWEHGILAFDRGVANGALKGATGIYGYEYSALASFQEAERRGLARIYEVPSPEHEFVENVIQLEIEQFPELDDGTRQYFLNRQARRTARRREEWALAEVVIANSTFTRDSYKSAGLDVSKVRVIPLGSPRVSPKGISGGSAENDPLRVLCAGNLSVLKGTHHLLSAWRKLAPENKAVLEMFGANRLPHGLTRDLPASIKLSPTIPRADLWDRFHSADVLVFPTLCDGFGMVITEAFAQGLPVITTIRAGASDLVRHGENGLIVPAGDPFALAEALEWCMAHRRELKSMRRAALETAAAWQWSDYRLALSRNVLEGLRRADDPA